MSINIKIILITYSLTARFYAENNKKKKMIINYDFMLSLCKGQEQSSRNKTAKL